MLWNADFLYRDISQNPEDVRVYRYMVVASQVTCIHLMSIRTISVLIMNSGIYIALFNVTCSHYFILCMFVQYRRDLSYTAEALESARRSLARIDRAVQRLEQQLRESADRDTGMNTIIPFIYCVMKFIAMYH